MHGTSHQFQQRSLYSLSAAYAAHCSYNRLLERFALGLGKWSLYLFAKSCCSRTHPGSLGIMSFRAEDSGITFQAPDDVGGAAECAKAHEGLPVACFR